jgi:hypothetical protein
MSDRYGKQLADKFVVGCLLMDGEHFPDADGLKCDQ